MISHIKTALLAEDRNTVFVLVSALILALLFEAFPTLILACESVLHTFGLSKNWNTAFVLAYAIIDAKFIFSLALLTTICGAFISS